MEKGAVLVSQSDRSSQALDVRFRLTDSAQCKWRILGIEDFSSESIDEKDGETERKWRNKESVD